MKPAMLELAKQYKTPKKTTFKALKGVGAQKVVIRIVGCCG
jgi:hypothetical protein